MTYSDRCLLSLILACACLFAVREAEYLARCRAQSPEIVVSVSGAVLRPGVVRLPSDARAVHAIDSCGGLSSQADPDLLELARPLQDGQHLIVPQRSPLIDREVMSANGVERPSPSDERSSGQEWPRASNDSSSPVHRPPPSAETRAPTVAAGDASEAPAREGPLDINQATVAELDSLPGVGPVLAQRIVEARQATPGGTFGSLEELGAIRGIKAKTLLRLKPHLKIEGS